MEISNFGRNVKFNPKQVYKPNSEAEVLDILNKHKNGQIRVIGGGHAWNDGIVSEDAFLDISNLNQVEVLKEGDQTFAVVGGGCKLLDLIKVLEKHNITVSAMGGIMRQSVAGLASTATHGTGKSSFSHYITEVRAAAFDPETQTAKIYEFNNGDELLAARTAVGCMGVILSIKIKCIPRYWVKENLRLVATLDEALENEKNWPLQQFAVFPYSWKFLLFARKTSEEPSQLGKLQAAFMRFVDFVTVEILPHIAVLSILKFSNNKNTIVKYYKDILHKVLSEVTVTNQDYKALTLHTRHHYYFRHVEMEVFIPESHVQEAFNVIRHLTEWISGTVNDLDSDLKEKLSQSDLLQTVLDAKEKYVYHYMMFFRHVLPDQTLISMTAGEQGYYAIGFFTYFKEHNRSGYYLYTRVMAEVLVALFNARLHWGKYIPLTHDQIEPLYPEMRKFRQIASKLDPNSVFQNDFTRRVLGFPEK